MDVTSLQTLHNGGNIDITLITALLVVPAPRSLVVTLLLLSAAAEVRLGLARPGGHQALQRRGESGEIPAFKREMNTLDAFKVHASSLAPMVGK